MSGGCFTKGNDVDSVNIEGGRTRAGPASSNDNRSVSSGQVNGGRTRQKRVVPNVTPTRKSSRGDGNVVSGEAKDVKQIGDHVSKNVQSSVTTSATGRASRNCPAVPKKNGVEIESMPSVAVPMSNGAQIPSTRPVAKTRTKQKSSDVVQALKIEAKSLPVNASAASNSIRIASENHLDKFPRTQNRRTRRSNGSSEFQKRTNEVEINPHVAGSSRNPKTKVTGQVEGLKITSTALATRSTSSLRRVETSKNGENWGNQLNNNVVIDQDLLRQRSIFEDSDDTLGISCILCNNDLMCFPPNYENHGIESSNLPEVAVLHCGHAFHSACLEDIIPPEEHCREPSCYLCLSNID